MKKTKIILSLVMFLLMTTLAWGVSSMTGKWQRSRTVLIYDTIHTIDANSLEMFIYNNGNFAYDNANIYGKTDGLYYPRGTKKTVIYDAGIWIGAKVNDAIRIAMAEYSSEFVPGPMKDGTFQPDKAEFKVYKIRRGDNATSNPDYRDWPVDQGAPVDDEGNPALIGGDQMTWSACNDADPSKHTNLSGSTKPLGVEVQQSTFAYARGGALGNTIFMKFKIINKGSNELDSTYISLWADPDLGDATDDLVGCDTALSLGYCYNSGTDATYGSAPPSVGFDFFQGPIVPGEATDSAYSFGVWNHGKKKLGMTAFSKYINLEDPQSASETYKFMKGYRKVGGQMILAVDPVTGDTTTFVFAGDPMTQIGWLDTEPNDRRFMMTSGPFTMAPGDSQEVVAAVMVGQGSDPLNSIGALKLVDQQAQAVFDLNFRIPNPPPPPTIWLRGADQRIDFIWDSKPINDVQKDTVLGQEFHFEGFNLYQGETSVGPWTKIATYDKDDDPLGVALIYNDVIVAGAGGAQRMVVQKGSNSGLKYHYTMSVSQLDGSTIKNNQPYYFSVTSYSYDYLNATEFHDPAGNLLGHVVETLESPITSVEVRPFETVGGFRHEATHTAGISDGRVQIDYIYPDSVRDADYSVTFTADNTWNLTDVTNSRTVLSGQTNQAGDYLYRIVDGMMVSVIGPEPGIASTARYISGTSNFAFDLRAAYMAGRNVLVNKDFDNFKLVFVAGPKDTIHVLYDTGDTVYNVTRYLDANRDTIWAYFNGAASDADRVSVPFKLYNLGPKITQQTPVRLWPLMYDFYGDYNWYIDDYIVLLAKTIQGNRVTEDFFSMPDRADSAYWALNVANPISRHDWDYRIGFGAAATWAKNDSVVFVTYKANIPDDVFEFTNRKAASASGDFIPLALDNVKTVPNPYYNYYQEEVDQFDRIVKFINLPAVPLKIRIFNIAGDLVRTMDRTDIHNSDFVWDLKTDQGLWVASGVYVWLIEGPGVGTKYGKMAIFTEVEQLKVF